MRNIKIFSLAIITIALFLADWLLINAAFYSGKSLVFWAWPILVSAFAITALLFFFISHASRRFTYLVMAILLGLYILVMPKDPYVMLGGAVFTILTGVFEQRIRAEEKARQDFSIRRSGSATLSVMVYALLLLITANIYYNTSTDFKNNPDAFYDRLGSAAVKRVPLLTREFIGVNLDQSLDQFIIHRVEEESPEFNSLSQQQKEILVNEAKEEFFQQFDLRVAGDRKLAEIMVEVAVDRIKQTAKDYEPFFPLIFTLIVLAFLRLFGFIFKWLTMAVAWFTFRILLRTGFFKLNKVPVEVEKLEI